MGFWLSSRTDITISVWNEGKVNLYQAKINEQEMHFFCEEHVFQSELLK